MKASMNTLDFGKFRDKTMEWVAVKEPCYNAWIIRNGAHREHFHGDVLGHYVVLNRRADALKLKTRCQTCKSALATGMMVTRDANDRAKSVFFHCAGCAAEKGFDLLPPSLLIWPMMNTEDRTGSIKVVSALMCACGVPMLQDASWLAMNAFFSNPDNFTLPAPQAMAA